MILINIIIHVSLIHKNILKNLIFILKTNLEIFKVYIILNKKNKNKYEIILNSLFLVEKNKKMIIYLIIKMIYLSKKMIKSKLINK